MEIWMDGPIIKPKTYQIVNVKVSEYFPIIQINEAPVKIESEPKQNFKYDIKSD